MRTKKIILGICIGSLLGLTGCGDVLPEMTQEQEDAIVEYAANIVMRYTKDYDSKLVDLSLYESPVEELQDTSQKEQGGMDPVADTPIVDSPSDAPTVDSQTGEKAGNIAQVLLPEGMDIRFAGYRLADSYPDDDSNDPFFALDASEGNKYLVLQFVLSNNTGTEQATDIFSTAARFTVLINGEERRPALTTMLLDDLGTYVGTLGAGEEIQLVLLSEIDNTLAENISNLRLSVTTNAGSVVMSLD